MQSAARAHSPLAMTEAAPLCAYEEQRLLNIATNNGKLVELGLLQPLQRAAASSSARRPKRAAETSSAEGPPKAARSSARLAQGARKDYTEALASRPSRDLRSAQLPSVPPPSTPPPPARAVFDIASNTVRRSDIEPQLLALMHRTRA